MRQVSRKLSSRRIRRNGSRLRTTTGSFTSKYLYRLPNEDGTWQRGRNLFSSGDTVTGRNGFEYRLTLVGDGWAVEVLPMTVNVAVTGSDATIALARSEDGTYRYDNVPVASGDTIRAGASTYTLRFASGRWTAVFVQGEIVVSLPAGDSVTLIKNASGNYEYNGTRIRSGSLVRSPATGIRYRLRLSNGEWSGSVYVPPTIGGGGGGEPGGGTPPVVSEDIKSALPSAITGTTESPQTADQIRPGLSDVSDIEYGAYAGSGRFQDDTFVESVIREIDKILVPIDSKGLADGNDSEQFVARVLIDNNWGNVKTALEKIFGADNLTLTANPPKSGSETDVSTSLRRLRDLRDNLSDVNEFKREYKTQIGDGNGDTIFKARKEVVALASTTNTRFGVRLTARTDHRANSSPIEYTTKQVFAYSPLSRTPETALPNRGTARYSGRTWALALDSGNLLYSGAIELLVSLGIARVEATVSGLRRSDNNASWQHEGDDVREIKLPRAQGSNFAGENDHFNAGGSATVVYSGVAVDRTVGASELKGRFVGTAADQRAGTAVIGTWKVGTALSGSYGAEYGATSSSRLPSVDSSVRAYRESDDATEDRDAKKVNLPGFDGDNDDADRFNLSSGTQTKRHPATGTVTARAELRIQSTSLTRFGAWNVKDSDGDSTSRGALAFSPLQQATYSASGADYPRRVSATYSGRTVAVDKSGAFYSGSYKLSVDWTSESVGGNIRAEISSLSGGSGRFHLGGQAVSRISFTDSFSGGTEFSSPDSTRVYFTNGTDRTSSGATHAGIFVGSGGPDGPYGVIGTWSLSEDPDEIKGGFGADLVTAP